MSTDSSKPVVAVLGGCGFIGRNLVDYLVANSLVSGIRVVDKTPPQTAWLNKKHASIFEDPIVEFRSANLMNITSCTNALAPNEGAPMWHCVINAAAETRGGQTDAVYAEGILTLSTNVATVCSRLGVRLVELSSSHLYSSDKIPHNEDGPIEPWSFEGLWKSKVEEKLHSMKPELQYSVIRPALTYGIGDRKSFTPRMLVGCIYKHLDEVMKLLWTSDLRIHTVHVRDLVRAIWFVANKPECIGQTYYVVDKADSTQGSITSLIAEIFGIQYEFVGNTLSNLAKADLAAIIEEANDKHLNAWAEICSLENIVNTPLDPTTRAELLVNKNINVDGSKLGKLGFKCEFDKPNVQLLREIINDFIEMIIFPKSILL